LTTIRIAEKEIERLVERAAGGDATAFGELYDIHVDRIYRHIYYRVGSTGDAEDLTQQVFINAWKAIGRFKKKSSPFAAWLMTISRNLLTDYYRARKTNISLNEDYDKTSEEPGPAQIAEVESERRELLQTIGRLPEEQREVVILRFIEDYSFGEIAAGLRKSEGAVRVILHRALKKLRDIMEEGKKEP
jgi:RNA polymerase sigma-70 factor (ECF subfamily)